MSGGLAKSHLCWCPDFLHQHERGRCAGGGVLHSGPVGHEDKRKIHVPVTLLLCGEVGKLLYYGSIELLYMSITLDAELGSGSYA